MKNLTVIFLCLFLASVAIGCGKKNGIRATYDGNINTYYELEDGTWSCDDRSYEYRLECRGRLPNAECDSVFVYLSNLPDISFELSTQVQIFKPYQIGIIFHLPNNRLHIGYSRKYG